MRSDEAMLLMNGMNCHPERSEGPAFISTAEKQILHFAQDDNFVVFTAALVRLCNLTSKPLPSIQLSHRSTHSI
jgi:hypothetical protein